MPLPEGPVIATNPLALRRRDVRPEEEAALLLLSLAQGVRQSPDCLRPLGVGVEVLVLAPHPKAKTFWAHRWMTFK